MVEVDEVVSVRDTEGDISNIRPRRRYPEHLRGWGWSFPAWSTPLFLSLHHSCFKKEGKKQVDVLN